MAKNLIVYLIVLLTIIFSVSAAAPVWISVPTQSLVSGVGKSLNLTNYITDSDGDSIDLSVKQDNSSVTCNIAGMILTMNPSSTFSGNSFCVIDAKALGDIVNHTITMTVAAQNPNFEDIPNILVSNAEKNSTITRAITVRNTGNIDLTNVTLSFIGDSRFKVNITPNYIATLAVTDLPRDILIQLHVPMSEAIGLENIGSINVRSDQKPENFSISLDVKSKLIISNLDVKVSGDNDAVSKGEKIKYKAKPEDKIEFEIDLENRFSDAQDIQIQDVVATVTIIGIDDGDDIELESDSVDITADDTDTVNLNFNVPLKVDEDTYDIEIVVEGEDDNGYTQKDSWTITLEVEKESHNVRITKYELNPTVVQCSRNVNLAVELMNLGSNEEDLVELEITNTELGINKREKDIYLDYEYDSEENIYEQTYSFLVPQDTQIGMHRIIIRSYYDEDVLDDIKYIDLNVNQCQTASSVPSQNQTQEQKEEEKPQTKPIEEPVETPETGITIEQPPTVLPTAPQSFRETGAYTALLILALITVAGAILMIIAKAFLKNKEE
jgi:hypothetical protein